MHEPTLRQLIQHLQISLIIHRPGAETPRVSRESRHPPLISTPSRPELHQMSIGRHTLRPHLPLGALHLLLHIIPALGPLLRLRGQGT